MNSKEQTVLKIFNEAGTDSAIKDDEKKAPYAAVKRFNWDYVASPPQISQGRKPLTGSSRPRRDRCASASSGGRTMES
jgi:hypothetical protein